MAYHIYISLYLFFIFVFYLFIEIESFTPRGRYAHSSVLVGNKFYYFGGLTDGGGTNEVFYLDVSKPFNIAAPPWTDLTASKGMPIRSYFGTVTLSDINNEQNIYYFGGLSRDLTTNVDSFKSLVYKFNVKSEQWEIPTVKGKEPERRRQMKAISDKSGKIYIFGGLADAAVGSTATKYFDDMIIFNAVELTWTISLLPNAPTPRVSYTATLLSSGVIVYIGGYDRATQIIDISQINLFDTNSLTWSVQTAKLTGQVESRKSHSAVLAPNGRIIVYGGSTPITGNFYAKVTPDLAVLNTETFEWTTPSVSSNVGIVPSLTLHTADIVENYMIVAFGNITQTNDLPLAKNTNIYMMDVRSYTWVNSFEPENLADPAPSTQISKPSPTTSTKTKNTSEGVNSQDVNSQLTTMKLVVGTVSGIVGTAVLMIVGFFGYKRYQRHQSEKQDEIMRIHGNKVPSDPSTLSFSEFTRPVTKATGNDDVLL